MRRNFAPARADTDNMSTSNPSSVIVAAIADWFFEASVLLSVFVVLEQLLSSGPFHWPLTSAVVAIALLFFSLGVYFRVRSKR